MVMGTFLPKETDSRKVIGVGYLLNLFVGVVVTYIFVYSLAATFPGTALLYGQSETVEALKFIKNIIGALIVAHSSEATKVLYLLVFSIYLAGMTTLIPLLEILGHIVSASTQSSRNRALSITLLMVLLLSLVFAVDTIRWMFLAAFFVYPFMVALEMIPLIKSGGVFRASARIYEYTTIVGLSITSLSIFKFVNGNVCSSLEYLSE